MIKRLHDVDTIDCRGISLAGKKRTLIMGILNVTPDSFSDGGRFIELPAAVEQAKEMIAAGADIIDIGGESTRPGFQPVSVELELQRVIPVIVALRDAVPHTPLSVDTYKAQVAREALKAGAHILNDIWGLKNDPSMGRVAAEFGCPIVLMHNRIEAVYDNFINDVIEDLRETVRFAHAAGVKDEQIILDPGIGFGKTYEHNLQLMNELHRIVDLGYPVLLGTSRKSMIQKTLHLPADDVAEGTAATVTIGIMEGCRIMRVHDVKAVKRTALMTDAIIAQRLAADLGGGERC